jgi:hypothetical protein
MPTRKKSPTLYKAVQLNGKDFATGLIDYGAAFAAGATVKHPNPGNVGDSDASTYLSVSVSASDLPGTSWPLRLFEVEPVGELWNPNDPYPHKRAVHELRIIREVPAHLVYGPEGERVRELIEAFHELSFFQRDQMYYGRPTEFAAAWGRVRSAACSLGVGSAPAWFDLELLDVGWYSGLGGALALLVRGIDPKAISDEDYETLTAPWRNHQGPVSPKDNLPAKGFTPKARVKK